MNKLCCSNSAIFPISVFPLQVFSYTTLTSVGILWESDAFARVGMFWPWHGPIRREMKIHDINRKWTFDSHYTLPRNLKQRNNLWFSAVERRVLNNVMFSGFRKHHSGFHELNFWLESPQAKNVIPGFPCISGEPFIRVNGYLDRCCSRMFWSLNKGH